MQFIESMKYIPLATNQMQFQEERFSNNKCPLFLPPPLPPPLQCPIFIIIRKPQTKQPTTATEQNTCPCTHSSRPEGVVCISEYGEERGKGNALI